MYLEIFGTGITNRSIDHIESFPNLVRLNLRGTSVDAAAAQLAMAKMKSRGRHLKIVVDP